jgi:two-component system response regulator HydG
LVRLRQAAQTDATVLLLGETGTGKDLVARSIHNNSVRKPKHFATLNCAAPNENLIEDDLFGHDPGAYTGGDRPRKGIFEYANGGTVFLDEIGDMPFKFRPSYCVCWKIAKSPASAATNRSRSTSA